MRTEGLTNNAIKMLDALSKDGLTHEALELFAVIEAYANVGGHSKEVIRTFDRIFVSGVVPNAYTYAVLIKGLAKDSKLLEARKFLMQMMEKRMRPDPSTYLAVFESYLRMQQLGDARMLLEDMKGIDFRPDEKDVREHLSKLGQVFKGRSRIGNLNSSPRSASVRRNAYMNMKTRILMFAGQGSQMLEAIRTKSLSKNAVKI